MVAGSQKQDWKIDHNSQLQPRCRTFPNICAKPLVFNFSTCKLERYIGHRFKLETFVYVLGNFYNKLSMLNSCFVVMLHCMTLVQTYLLHLNQKKRRFLKSVHTFVLDIKSRSKEV